MRFYLALRKILVGVTFIGLVLCVSACNGIKNGDYFGGLVNVSGLSEKNSQQATTGSDQQAQTNDQDIQPKTNATKNLTAKANAQGVCWVGCKSKEPTPMDSVEFSVSGVDVDTAYIRIKRDFGFSTRSERIEKDPSVEGWLENTLDFRYQATPGVNYLMRGYKEHTYLDEETPNTIQIELFKDGMNEILVKASFYSGNTQDLQGYKQSLRDRIMRVIKR